MSLLTVACGPANVLDEAIEAELDAVPCGRPRTMFFATNGATLGREDAVTFLTSGPGWLEIETQAGHRLAAHWEAPALFSTGASFETQDAKLDLALSDGTREVTCGRTGSAVRIAGSENNVFLLILRDLAIGTDCAEAIEDTATVCVR